MERKLSRSLSEVELDARVIQLPRRCDGLAHATGTRGHDATAHASVRVHCRCDCGIDETMLLCASRVQFVLAAGEMDCGACGATHDVREFWDRIDALDDGADATGAPAVAQSHGDEQVLQAWHHDLVARGCTEKSITGMLSAVHSFAKRVGIPLAHVTRDHVVEYLASPGWTAGTRRTYRTTLSGFYDWMTERGEVASNPAARLPRVRLPYSEPDPLTTEQIETLMNSGIYAKTRMMVLLAAYQGLRVSEIAAVHSRDVDLDEGWLHIPNGKGGTSLRRPLHHLVLEHARRMDAPNGYWFPGLHGRPHISGSSVSQTLSNAMRRAGIVGHRPHQLRAWHATEMVHAGVDAITVQHSMRHATLGTLHKYVHPSAARVSEGMSALPVVTLREHHLRRSRAPRAATDVTGVTD